MHAQRTHIATSTALHAQAGTAQGTTDTDSQTNTPNNEQPQLPQDKLIPTAANDNGITNDKKTRKRERQQRVREILRGTPFEDPRVKPTRVLVEICCADDSLLSSGNCKHSDGCLCVRITEKDDFNSDRGVQKILDILHYFSDIPILLWRLCVQHTSKLATRILIHQSEDCRTLATLPPVLENLLPAHRAMVEKQQVQRTPSI